MGREFNKRLKKRFDEAGVEIPYPHLTIYPGQLKGGASSPFVVSLQGSSEGGVDRG